MEDNLHQWRTSHDFVRVSTILSVECGRYPGKKGQSVGGRYMELSMVMGHGAIPIAGWQVYHGKSRSKMADVGVPLTSHDFG